jgi:hypothetical protein
VTTIAMVAMVGMFQPFARKLSDSLGSRDQNIPPITTISITGANARRRRPDSRDGARKEEPRWPRSPRPPCCAGCGQRAGLTPEGRCRACSYAVIPSPNVSGTHWDGLFSRRFCVVMPRTKAKPLVLPHRAQRSAPGERGDSFAEPPRWLHVGPGGATTEREPFGVPRTHRKPLKALAQVAHSRAASKRRCSLRPLEFPLFPIPIPPDTEGEQ